MSIAGTQPKVSCDVTRVCWQRFWRNDIKLDLAFIHILGSRDKPYTAVRVGVLDHDWLQPVSSWRLEDAIRRGGRTGMTELWDSVALLGSGTFAKR